jgi:hypothetical protein
VSASAATAATFTSGVLTVFGDGADNSIVISGDPAGRILVNNGAIAVAGGSPTIANASLIEVIGAAGNDVIRVSRPTARCRGRSCSAGSATTR